MVHENLGVETKNVKFSVGVHIITGDVSPV